MKKTMTVPMQPQPDFLAPQPATTPRSTLLKTTSFESYDSSGEQYPCQEDDQAATHWRRMAKSAALPARMPFMSS